jgi:nucleoside-diphosphate-sugar epimerase
VSHPVVVLGAGYTGRYLLNHLASQARDYYATSRNPDLNLGYPIADRRLQFDLSDTNTWANIPRNTDLLWCFPAIPLETVQQFTAAMKGSCRRLVVLGSASAYDIGENRIYPPPWIDEAAPVEMSRPRVQGEEFLRQACAAIVLRIAGIYGPGRDPLEWIKSGRVGPSRKYVNLIHVEDLAGIVLGALERGRPGEIYNVIDGTPRTWDEICKTVEDRWKVRSPISMQHQKVGKRIDTRKLILELQPQLSHPNLYEALAALPRG